MSKQQVNEASAKYIVQKKRPAQSNAAESLITQHLDLWSSAIASKNTTGRGSNKKIELYGVKKLRELILELAVRGKLVPQDSNDEPASEFIKKIYEERCVLADQGLTKKPKAPKPNGNITPLFQYRKRGAGLSLVIYRAHPQAMHLKVRNIRKTVLLFSG